MATLHMPRLPDDPVLDEDTGKPVEPDTNKPVDQKGPFRPSVPPPVSANRL